MLHHIPVLLTEVLTIWHTKKGGFYIDGTVGLGGHSEALLKKDPEAQVLGIDRDPQSLEIAKERLKEFGSRIFFVQDNFKNIKKIMKDLKLPKANGLLFDLGISSFQLEDGARGFSFQRAGPLDMRMDPDINQTAENLIRDLSIKELAEIIQNFGEEKRAKKIAFEIKRQSLKMKLNTLKLSQIISKIVHPNKNQNLSIHPATRTFQALRIATNKELENLKLILKETPDLLQAGAHSVWISFHSLEDRIIKNAIRDWTQGCICPKDFPQCVCQKHKELFDLTRKAIVAGEKEALQNPRSRSAKLRAVEKI
ncbi:MAG: 16S rRNA (cytosine(1402)-N(4))-methyltransferase [Elusimicrobia bacterium RIFCSPLOWO2_02_FULL_39_32]|nr:MAG: 16S rRNA (cytosine(1402)-N(4))-methyltransferase [Elusimicrobia bacterium RIFCSPHIGHO2_02_FULL_39_36]OGR93156.1 MAG: 16S rRNA (cytosine(1402)-N(4))-methyltransferase [Elusimicrobia bacterium RIFCSPLOWO2_02_FULL_39_32]OGR99381.1 MAG: 16S rRNA (cytosine(1402)-N(4))-methyltransferase [Elusimicrobia bacterium RIFCSPLOWO2_12_FULL_39_28]